MGIPVVTREYNQVPAATLENKWAFPLATRWGPIPLHFVLRSSAFPNKDIRNLDFPDGTEENPQEHCHDKIRTLMSPQECKIDWCTPNQLNWSTYPLHLINSHLAIHIIYHKWLDILYINPEIPWDTHFKSIVTSISVKQQDERPGHPNRLEMRADSLSSTEEVSHFFHKHLKRSFPLGICMWEGPCVLCFKRNGPRDALIRNSSNFPAEASCMLIVHITRWKDVWVPCRDPRKSPRPPLPLKNGPNMPLTTRKPRGVHCFKFWRCLTIF